MTEIQRLNIALAKACGIENPEQLLGFELKVKAGRMPVVEARYMVRTSDGLNEVVDTFRLEPKRDAQAGRGE